ncbi:MAG: DUF2141 domain-containing protein [Saprospiraceae bacterium]
MFLIACLLAVLGPSSDSVAVQLNGITQTKGTVRIALFDSEQGFQQRTQPVYGISLRPNSTGQLQFKLPVHTHRPCAVAIFHDLNNNGKLDTNLMGIPSEPYGFSRPPSSKWKAPSFTDVSLVLAQHAGPLRITLKTWGDY